MARPEWDSCGNRRAWVHLRPRYRSQFDEISRRTLICTQVKRLTEFLNAKGHKATSLNFPNRTTDTGAVINAYLQSGKELGQSAPSHKAILVSNVLLSSVC